MRPTHFRRVITKSIKKTKTGTRRKATRTEGNGPVCDGGFSSTIVKGLKQTWGIWRRAKDKKTVVLDEKAGREKDGEGTVTLVNYMSGKED